MIIPSYSCRLGGRHPMVGTRFTAAIGLPRNGHSLPLQGDPTGSGCRVDLVSDPDEQRTPAATPGVPHVFVTRLPRFLAQPSLQRSSCLYSSRSPNAEVVPQKSRPGGVTVWVGYSALSERPPPTARGAFGVTAEICQIRLWFWRS